MFGAMIRNFIADSLVFARFIALTAQVMCDSA
jgi:hypothetical protein